MAKGKGAKALLDAPGPQPSNMVLHGNNIPDKLSTWPCRSSPDAHGSFSSQSPGQKAPERC